MEFGYSEERQPKRQFRGIVSVDGHLTRPWIADG